MMTPIEFATMKNLILQNYYWRMVSFVFCILLTLVCGYFFIDLVFTTPKDTYVVYKIVTLIGILAGIVLMWIKHQEFPHTIKNRQLYCLFQNHINKGSVQDLETVVPLKEYFQTYA